jgi:1,4-dihydroxy-2-naphthoate octaprenyltransferase
VAFVLMQIGCNLVNDACDFLRGADGPARTGPTRVSQAGVFRAGTVHLCGVACLVLSAACMTPAALDLEYHTPGGFPTEVTPTASTNWLGPFSKNTYRLKHEPFEVSDVQWPIALLATFSIAAAYGYTGGPFPLAYHGLGDFTVIVFFGVVAVALARRTHLGTYEAPKESDGTYYSSHLTNDLRRTLLNEDALVAGAQTGALACVLLAVNNVRDRNTDAAANKKTLAVKYGLEFVKREIDVLLTFAFACTWYWWFTRVPFSNVTRAEVGAPEELLTSTETNTRETRWSYASTAPCLTIPLALSVSRRARLLKPGHGDCDGVLAAAAALHFAFGGLLAVGIWLDGSMGAEGDTDRR